MFDPQTHTVIIIMQTLERNIHAIYHIPIPLKLSFSTFALSKTTTNRKMKDVTFRVRIIFFPFLAPQKNYNECQNERTKPADKQTGVYCILILRLGTGLPAVYTTGYICTFGCRSIDVQCSIIHSIMQHS